MSVSVDSHYTIAAELDIVQLWSMKNYHYYLKQELHGQSGKRLRGFRWHPEQPMKLFIIEDGAYQR